MTKKFACGLYFITVKIYHAKNLLLKKKKKEKKGFNLRLHAYITA